MAITKFKGKYRFLSNFWPVEIEFADMVFPSVEHAFQAIKTLDVEDRKKIQKCSTAAEAKRRGKKD
jgi:predicted NAD-dependent protein-ADP-ribosyltransferase YbiA (DUF1768 family)